MSSYTEDLIAQCIDIAHRTNAFSEAEIDVLEEVLRDWAVSQGKEYSLRLFFDDQKVSGFVIFGMTPMTKYAWDVYWIAVDPELQGKGIGKSLMAQVEREAVGQAGQAILRIETSGKSTYTRQRSFYKSCGFEEKGRIEDFYQLGDDLVIYAKKISRA